MELYQKMCVSRKTQLPWNNIQKTKAPSKVSFFLSLHGKTTKKKVRKKEKVLVNQCFCAKKQLSKLIIYLYMVHGLAV